MFEVACCAGQSRTIMIEKLSAIPRTTFPLYIHTNIIDEDRPKADDDCRHTSASRDAATDVIGKKGVEFSNDTPEDDTPGRASLA